MHWRTTRFRIDLDDPARGGRPLVMGIVNATPDSFSDGGLHDDPARAAAHCDRLVAEGADLLDIGGESTRPGARAPTPDEELARVLPVVRHALGLGVPVSVDTSEPAVIRAVLDAGADVVNDVRALARPGALEAVAAHGLCGVVLMHMRGEPGAMQSLARYGDVVAEVGEWLAARAGEVEAAGVARERIAIDPGIGFAKTPEHNWALLRRQRELPGAWPLLAGWSRKSTLGLLTGRPAPERLGASVGAALAAALLGARIVRVHDVAPTVDALKVAAAAGLLPPPLRPITPGEAPAAARPPGAAAMIPPREPPPSDPTFVSP